MKVNNTELSCNKFIQAHKQDIKEMLSWGMTFFDIFMYYHSNWETKWHDCSSFRVYCHENDIRYTEIQEVWLRKTYSERISKGLRARTPEQVQSWAEKYKETLSKTPIEVRKKRIQKELETKSKWTDKQKQHRIDAMIKTKKKNNTLSSSYSQDLLQRLFSYLYPKTEIEYNKDPRYPFCADIYIPELDLFIELNTHWTHHIHPFDKNYEEDIRYKNILTSKAHSNQYYKIALEVWTEKDVKKLNTAYKNNLNYICIYNLDNSNLDTFIERDVWMYKRGVSIIDMKNI